MQLSKLLAASLLLFLFAGPALAQESSSSPLCAVEGESLTLSTRVRSVGRRFRVRTTGDVQATLRGRTAHVNVASYLAFSGRVPLEELKLEHEALASLGGGVLRTNVLPHMLVQPFVRGASIEAGLNLQSFRTSRVSIPCEGFRLVRRAHSVAYAKSHEVHSLFRHDRATIHVAPNAPAPVTLRGIAGYLVDVREERGRWSLVESDLLLGWVRTRVLERYEPSEGTIGLGNLGAIGHGGGGSTGYQGGDEGVIEVGTGVFASAQSAEPWAVVLGSESLWLRSNGEWTEIVQAPDITARSGVMWVRSEHVRYGVSVRHGTTLVRRKRNGRSYIEVTAMEEFAMGPERHGLQVGDQITGASDVPQNEFDAAPITWLRRLEVLIVRRGGERIELVHPCRTYHLEHPMPLSGSYPHEHWRRCREEYQL